MTRNDILNEAIRNCFREMYKKAQPSADYDEIVEKVKSGEIEDSNENPVFERYYLSMEEFNYIKDKYIEAYRLKHQWNPNIELLESYLKEGGTKDKYIPEHTDEEGFTHPGYRGYEKVLPLRDQIVSYLRECGVDESKVIEMADGINGLTLSTINDCKEFYCFDREEYEFCVSVSLGASPTSNKKKVIEYWKSKGIEVKIEDRNPLLLWEMEEYGEDFEDVMKSEYGDNWEEYWWQKYREEQEEKRKENERRLMLAVATRKDE